MTLYELYTKIQNGVVNSAHLQNLQRIILDLKESAVVDLVNELIDNNETLSSLPARYSHTNGFDKFKLIETSEFVLRLHIWWGERDYEEIEHVHDHKWNFASRVLFGNLKSQQFVVSDSGDRYMLYDYYSAGKQNEEARLIPSGERTLELVYESELHAGSTYSISAKILHRVLQPSMPTATLMLHGKPVQKSASVYSQKEILTNDDNTVQIKHLNDDESRQKLLKLLTYLKKV